MASTGQREGNGTARHARGGGPSATERRVEEKCRMAKEVSTTSKRLRLCSYT